MDIEYILNEMLLNVDFAQITLKASIIANLDK